MIEYCKALVSSIYQPGAVIRCHRYARRDGYCEHHHPQALEAERAARKHAEQRARLAQQYNEACRALGHALVERTDTLKLLETVEPQLVKQLKRRRSALKKLEKG